jgi:predicted acyl esterase
MWVNEAASNAYTSSLRQGGALELRFLCWLFWHAALNTNPPQKADPTVAAALNAVRIREQLDSLPLLEGETPLALLPDYEQHALNILQRGDYDAFWEDPSVNVEKHWPQYADVPTVFSSAWYDSYTRANIENFVGLSEQKKGPVRLLMGPWTHGDAPMGETFAGDIDLGSEAPIDYDEERLQWFDHWLKGRDNGVDAASPARLFVMGGGDGRRNQDGRLNHGGQWLLADTWPLPQTTPCQYHLHADHTLRPEAPDGEGGTLGFTFDPADPVPTVGGSISSLCELIPVSDRIKDMETLPSSARIEPESEPGGFDQRVDSVPLADRPDVLVFESAPLAEAMTVIGPVSVALWVSSDAPDTDFTAKLIDVYPPNPDYPEGYALNITDGIMRARYRDSWSAPEVMTPGAVYELTIVLYPTANIFAAGHRLRLDISSSNFPRFDVNPNTGEPLGRNTGTRVARNTVHLDLNHPSCLTLAVVPSERAQPVE